jgi:hypothetical protein
MADPKLVRLLEQGSEVWNRWRERHPKDVLVDLSKANLRKTKLRGANLREVNLCEAELSWTELSGIDLFHADLRGAHLFKANLIGANLIDSNLSGADLHLAHLSNTDLHLANLSNANLSDSDLRFANLFNADLSGTDLHGANLSNANLRRANLSRTNLEKSNWTHANIGWSQLDNLDLCEVIGLETVQHSGPSTIGLDTIYQSKGQIPEAFLRGAGVPETFITNMRALIASMSPIDYYTCFISYSHQNKDFVQRLYADLQREGVRCWYAEEDLKIGDHYHQRIDEAIRLYDKLILVLSDAAVQSAWVEREVVAAREKEDRRQREVLFPLRLDDAVMEAEKAWAADVRRRWQIGDFTCWKDHDRYRVAFEQLLRDLRAENSFKGDTDGK